MKLIEHHPHDTPDHPAGKRKRRRLRSLQFLPTIITLANLVCGFAAIHFGLRAMLELGLGAGPEPVEALRHMRVFERMLPSFLSLGAGLVILGMIFDCFDGLIARVTRSTTNFGGQLDSLADVITFGAAPGILIIALMTKELAGDAVTPSPLSEHFLGRVAWVASAIYCAFAAIRLARFNVEHAQAGASYKTFRGLPSPGAAALLISLVLLYDQLAYYQPSMTHLRTALVYCMPGIVLAAAFLMVSRIPYRRFGRGFLLGRQPFGRFLLLMLVVVLFVAYKAPTFFVVVCLYVLHGPAAAIARILRGKSKLAVKQPPPGAETTPAQHSIG